MDPATLSLLIGGGMECGKMLLMAYLENQRIAGKTKEEIEVHIKEVADEFYNLPDPAVILEEMAKTIRAQQGG